MRILVWIYLILLTQPGFADAVAHATASARLAFEGSPEYSCRIYRHRAAEVARTSAGLDGLLGALAKKKAWAPTDYVNLDAYMQKAGFLSPDLFARRIRLDLEWNLRDTPEWQNTMSSSQRLSANFSFKGWRWSDAWGILPSEIVTSWYPKEGILKMQIHLSPGELCFGDGGLTLDLKNSASGEILNLNAQVRWL